MNADINLVIQNMQEQIATLAKEKAIYYAIAAQKEQELSRLKQELENLKNTKHDSE